MVLNFPKLKSDIRPIIKLLVNINTKSIIKKQLKSFVFYYWWQNNRNLNIKNKEILSVFSMIIKRLTESWNEIPPPATPITGPLIFLTFYVKIRLFLDFTLLHRHFYKLYKKSILPHNTLFLWFIFQKSKGVPLSFLSKLITREQCKIFVCWSK